MSLISEKHTAQVYGRGEIGPKTYARTREDLLDALSRLIAEEQREKSGPPLPALPLKARCAPQPGYSSGASPGAFRA